MSKRYGNPLAVFELAEGGFSSFIDTILEQQAEEMLFDMWLHKEYERSWQQFKDDNMQKNLPKIGYDDIVQNSIDILDRGL